MKYAFAAVAFAALAQAQGLSSFPKCAQSCLEDGVKTTDCDVSDIPCVCENLEAIQGSATACVIKECGAETAINEVLPAAEALCAGGGSAPEETTSAAPEEAEETTTAVEDVPEETTSAVEETKSEEPVVEPTPVPLPTPTSVSPPVEEEPEPEVTPPVTGGAAALGSMGALAMVVLGAFAL